MNDLKPLRILVTGGAGFLGKAIIDELLDNELINPDEIIAFDIKPKPTYPDQRIVYIRGDIRDKEKVFEVTKGVDAIIHAAAIVDWGTHSAAEVYEVNYTGTENIIAACKANQIKYLVYTSTLDVVINGKPLRNIDETQPYPEKHVNMYCESKYLAEKLVIESNNENLQTSVLRPSDVFGEGDPYHIDSLVDMAKTGFYIRLGNGRSKCQHVYVRNMASAHIQLLSALVSGNTEVLGQTYFITDGPSANFFSFFDQIIVGAGYTFWPRNLWLPMPIAYAIGSLSEFFALILRPVKHYNPKFSRFAVFYTCTDFTFTSDKAKKDFGFKPPYALNKAIENTIKYYTKR